MILVLAYHSISDHTYRYAASAQVFEQQLRWLQRRFRFVSLPELEQIVKEPKLPRENIAHVTFDDGLQDNLINGLPVLKKLNIPATIFVPTALIGTVITNPTTGIKFPVLTWSELRQLESSGLVWCESHTHTHPLLTEIHQSEVESELRLSKEALENGLQKKVVALAYPKGNFNNNVANQVAEYYRLAFGPIGVIRSLPAQLTALPRVIVSADVPSWKFKAQSYDWFWQLRQLKYGKSTI